MGIFGKQQAVGLDITAGGVRALALDGSADKPRITGRAAVPIVDADGATATAQAIHAALAQARADGAAVVAAVGGPEVVVRQITLPPVPPARILQILEMQHREFGLLAPGEGLLDAQILRRSKSECSVLAVSVPKALVEARQRMLEQAAVKLRTLEVEPLALLNAADNLAKPEPSEVLVTLDLGDERSLLCFLSERGPVVVRYLEVGAAALLERLDRAGVSLPSRRTGALTAAEDMDMGRAADACRDIVRRIADEIRMSLAYYRSEYDREGLPRYALSGWVRISQLNRWLTDELRLESPFEVLDPFQAVRVTASPGDVEESAGPEFVQAFGLALRAL